MVAEYVEDYPSDEVLARVRTWGDAQIIAGADPDWRGLFGFMESVWPDYGVVRKRPATEGELGLVESAEAWEFVTGGWSGCEDLIGAFYENAIARSVLWESTHRGGLHVLVLR